MRKDKLQQVLDRAIDKQKIFGTSFCIKKNGEAWCGASGDLTIGQPYFIASTTKLFTTAVILQLLTENKLSLNTPISAYVEANILHELHMYKDYDYSAQITIQHLLAHTSGLPDYFQGKNEDGKSLELELTSGTDIGWTFEEAIDRTKTLFPLFSPGAKGKANYSDTNFQLLGKIIELITGRSIAENYNQRIITPLQLSQTYLYSDPEDKKPKHLYFKNSPLLIPKAMASFGPDGGMVSTSTDMLTFIEAFFTGKLFPASLLPSLQKWNRIFFPMKSGIGIHQFKLPWIFTFGSVPEFIGHSGLSGALAYYAPSKNIFVAGTVNQVAYPDKSFKVMIKLIQSA